MKKTQETLRKYVSTKTAVLHVAFELSNSKWKLGFSDGNKMRFKGIDARNLEQLEEEIEKAKSRFKLDDDVRIVSCYKAANWLYVGQTKGRGKLDVLNSASLPKKDIFLFPLSLDFKKILCTQILCTP